jgi:alkylation response protein AidB-like acyl-CoA dehydrogenase
VAEVAGPIDQLQRWLAERWDPELTLAQWWARLGASGWSQPHWPPEWFGRGLLPTEARAVTRTIRQFGAVTAPRGFGPDLVGPTLLEHGTADQKARHLPGIVTGTDAYCQLFSEPSAGSDLAGLQCRAVRDGDQWVVNGHKVWTSGGQIANRAMLVARTDVDAAKHAGLSFFLVDMLQQGVEVRPLREMTGRTRFNEVFLTDVRVPAADLVGGAGNGWPVAGTTLAFERAASGGDEAGASAPAGPLAGNLSRRAGDFAHSPGAPAAPSALEPDAARLAEAARALGYALDPGLRQDLVALYVLEQLRSRNSHRARALQESGRPLPGIANLAKMAENHTRRLGRDVTFAVLGAAGMLHAYDDQSVAALEAQSGIEDHAALVEHALFAQGPPIYGGSDQIQRNIVGERVLGLPKEPRPGGEVPSGDRPNS